MIMLSVEVGRRHPGINAVTPVSPDDYRIIFSLTGYSSSPESGVREFPVKRTGVSLK
jgi:hypothetical protein